MTARKGVATYSFRLLNTKAYTFGALESTSGF